MWARLGTGSTRFGRGALLTSTAVGALSLAAPAFAACDIAAAPNTVSCAANTATTDTTNNDAGTVSSIDRLQEFSTGGNVTGSIAGGVTIGGYGLTVRTSEAGPGIAFTNNGSVNQTTSPAGGSGSLGLFTAGGAITYNSANGATISGVATSALALFQGSSGANGDLTAHVNGDVANVAALAAATGVFFANYGTGRIVLDGTGDIRGGTGIEVHALNATGDADITVSGSGNISFNQSGGEGILVQKAADTGTVTIDRTGTIIGVGAGSAGTGITVSSAGSGGTFITGVGAISNVRYGISAFGFDNFTVTPGGSISASNTAIYAQLVGSGAITITSAFDLTGGSTGITVTAQQGTQNVTVTGGTISATAAGVRLYGNGTGLITFGMSGGTIFASTGVGVSMDQSDTGSIVFNQTGGSIGLVGTPTATNGIYARARTGGTVDVTAGTVYATGTAIWAQVVSGGTAHVVANGPVNSVNGSAIETSAATGNTTIINNGALTAGTASAGVVRATSTTGAISITNNAAGSIASNLASPETQLAVLTSGGATTIVNAGALTGRMTLASATNSVTNSGTWNTAGANDFGTGTTTVSNSGTINLGIGTSFTGGSLNVTNTAAGQIVGPLNISTGNWANNGVITGDVTVNGGVLGGTGTIVGTTMVNNGGILAPGNSIGTLHVSGNVNFAPGGVYQVEVSSAAADRTVATGTATLTGGTVQVIQIGAGFTVGQSQTILTAAGGLGGTTFAGLTSGALNAHLGYDANNVYLVVDSIGLTNVLPNGTVNQRNVAAGIDTAMNGGAGAGGFAPVLTLTGAALGNALNHLSGEVATGGTSMAFQTTDRFLALLTGPFGGALNNNGAASGQARGFAAEGELPPDVAAAYAAVTPKDELPAKARANSPAFTQRWNVWGAAYGGAARANGDSLIVGSHDVSARTYGVAAGADYRVSADTILGFATGGGGTGWGLSNGLGSGRGDVFQLGAYGMHRHGAAYVTAALSYAWHGMTTDRSVTVAGLDRLTASFNAQSLGGRIESGYRFAWSFGGITPYAALQAQAFHTPSFSETAASGSNAFALSYNAKTASTLRTELGGWFDSTMAAGPNAVLTLRARAAWVHDSNTDRNINAVFQTLPGASFTVNGASAAKDAALLSLGSDLRLANNVSLGLKFDSEVAQGSRSFAGQGIVRYAW